MVVAVADAPRRTRFNNQTRHHIPDLHAARPRSGLTGDYRRDPDTQVR
jgi:hypothetical protein